jgi:hypothetical protein
MINGKKPAAIGKRPLVCRAVFGANIAPIGVRVIGQRRGNLVIAERPHGVRGHHHLTERKPSADAISERRMIHRFVEWLIIKPHD